MGACKSRMWLGSHLPQNLILSLAILSSDTVIHLKCLGATKIHVSKRSLRKMRYSHRRHFGAIFVVMWLGRNYLNFLFDSKQPVRSKKPGITFISLWRARLQRARTCPQLGSFRESQTQLSTSLGLNIILSLGLILSLADCTSFSHLVHFL